MFFFNWFLYYIANIFNYIKKKQTINYYSKRKIVTIEKVNIFKDELFSRTWYFNRMEWCLPITEQKDLQKR